MTVYHKFGHISQFQKYFTLTIRNFYLIIYTILYYLFCAIGFWLFMVIFWPLFLIVSFFINTVLKIRHGEQYGGLLRKQDSVFDRIEITKCAVTVLMIIKSVKPINMMDYMKKKIQDKVFDRPYDDYIKLTSTRHRFLGYPYYKKNDYSINECVLPMPLTNKEFTEEDLKDMISQQINSPFPKEDHAMWELLVSETHMKKEDKDSDGYRYAIVIRFHHAVADGTSLVAFIINTLSNTTTENYNVKIFNKKQNDKKIYSEKILESIKMFIENIIIYLYLIFITPGVNANLMLTRGEKNGLSSPQMTGKSNIVWPTTKNINYVSKIKRLKNTITGTKFSQIIFTALSVSLSRFFKRNQLKIPDSLLTMVPIVLHYPDLDHSKPTELLNKTSQYILNLYTGETITLLDALNKVKNYMDKTSMMDVMATHLFLSKIGGIFPSSWLTIFAKLDYPTLLVTNIPGGEEMKLSDTMCVEKVIPIPPIVGGMGCAFATVTYGDQFTICLHVDKSILSDKNEAQKIVDSVLFNFDILEKEMQELKQIK